MLIVWYDSMMYSKLCIMVFCGVHHPVGSCLSCQSGSGSCRSAQSSELHQDIHPRLSGQCFIAWYWHRLLWEQWVLKAVLISYQWHFRHLETYQVLCCYAIIVWHFYALDWMAAYQKTGWSLILNTLTKVCHICREEIESCCRNAAKPNYHQ